MPLQQSLPIFELKQVTHHFDSVTALIDINLKIFPGERVGLIGSSGAGKSTLLRLLNGSLFASQGEVLTFHCDLATLSARRLRQVQRQIGTIDQQFNLVGNLAVIHNVNAGHLGKWPFWKALLSLLYPLEVETALAVLQKVGMADQWQQRTDQLSGGQQQRVALARVMVQDPLVILADEPISSLDQKLSQEVMEILLDFSLNYHKTLVTSLHSLDFARRYCDRLIGLRAGQIIFDLPPAQLNSDQVDCLYQLY